MSVPELAGWTVGITAARRREELGGALERRGAQVVYGPAIRIVPLADDTQLLESTKRCLDEPLDYVVATTGIGFRGWMDAADSWGLTEPLHKALASATILTRGPKVRGAVRAKELREAWSPESESSAEVRDHMLAGYELAGKRVAVQLHGEPLRDLVDALREAGAEVLEVPVYRWEQPAEQAPLHRLIDAVCARTVDVLTFTSAPAAVNFLQTAERLGRSAQVAAALAGPVLVAAVGPVTAAPLVEAGVAVVQPERFRLGALVRSVVEAMPARARSLRAAGHALELRGQGVVVDDAFLPMTGSSLALLRALADPPGQVFSREALACALPDDSIDGHAVEVAIARLRNALGDPAIVATVVRRGYRLAVD